MANETLALPETVTEQPPQNFWQKNKIAIIAGSIGLIVILGLIGLIYLGAAHPAATAIARDIMIISMAVVSVFIGLMLIVLIYQIAELTSLLREEIKPMLESAAETMNTLRGTAVFMSDNLVEPTIKASSTAAGAMRMLEVLMGLRPSTKRKP